LLPFKGGPVNEREARKSGLWLKAWVAAQKGRNRKPVLLGEDVRAYHVPPGSPGTNIEHQAVGYALADAKIAIEAVRYLSWRACYAVDMQSPAADELASRPKSTAPKWQFVP
jgi:hypothetical protein